MPVRLLPSLSGNCLQPSEVTEDSTEDDEGNVSYYTLSPVVVTKCAVTFSHKIILLKYLPLITCFFMAYNPYNWLGKCPCPPK